MPRRNSPQAVRRQRRTRRHDPDTERAGRPFRGYAHGLHGVILATEEEEPKARPPRNRGSEPWS